MMDGGDEGLARGAIGIQVPHFILDKYSDHIEYQELVRDRSGLLLDGPTLPRPHMLGV